jgi:hypothetical protein
MFELEHLEEEKAEEIRQKEIEKELFEEGKQVIEEAKAEEE